MANSLSEYIVELGGDAAFAEKYAVSVLTARAYRLGKRLPRLNLMADIMNDSGLTFVQIMAGDPSPRPRGGARPATRKNDKRLKENRVAQ